MVFGVQHLNITLLPELKQFLVSSEKYKNNILRHAGFPNGAKLTIIYANFCTGNFYVNKKKFAKGSPCHSRVVVLFINDIFFQLNFKTY